MMSTHCRSLDADTNFAYYGEPVTFIGKESLFQIPIFGKCASECGNISIKRTDNAQAINALKDAALTCKNEKRTVGIFPEGTRRRRPSIGNASQLLPFKKGPFYLARDADAVIIPAVHVGCSRLARTFLPEWGEKKFAYLF